MNGISPEQIAAIKQLMAARGGQQGMAMPAQAGGMPGPVPSGVAPPMAVPGGAPQAGGMPPMMPGPGAGAPPMMPPGGLPGPMRAPLGLAQVGQQMMQRRGGGY